MNETKTLALTRRESGLARLFQWFFKSDFEVLKSDHSVSQGVYGKFFGGLVTFGLMGILTPTVNCVTIKIGVGQAHIDLDLMTDSHPELDKRNDRIPNLTHLQGNGVDYLSWFAGLEGVGIYYHRSIKNRYGVSGIEIGAHPLLNLGVYNLYQVNTQHAILSVQFTYIQISFHAAIDTKSTSVRETEAGR